MRTSNKILIGALLAALLAFGFPVIWVRAKFAAGSFTTKKTDSDFYNGAKPVVQTFGPDVKTLVLTGLENVTLYPSDTLRVEYFNDENSPVRVHTENGALYINDDTVTTENTIVNIRSYVEIKVYMPQLDSIRVINSQVYAKGVSDPARALPNYRFNIEYSQLALTEEGSHTGDCKIGTVTVKANAHSDISTHGRLIIDKADYRLTNESDFDDNLGINYGQLSIQADSTSTLKLKGGRFKKANITSIE